MSLILSKQIQINHPSPCLNTSQMQNQYPNNNLQQNQDQQKVKQVLILRENRILLMFDFKFIVYNSQIQLIQSQSTLKQSLYNIKLWNQTSIIAIQYGDPYLILLLDVLKGQILHKSKLDQNFDNSGQYKKNQMIPQILRFQNNGFVVLRKNGNRQKMICFYSIELQNIKNHIKIQQIVQIYQNKRQTVVCFEQHIINYGKIQFINKQNSKTIVISNISQTQCLLQFITKISEVQAIFGYNCIGKNGCFFQLRNSQSGEIISKIYSNNMGIFRHILTDLYNKIILYTTLETSKIQTKSKLKKLYSFNFNLNKSQIPLIMNICDQNVSQIFEQKIFVSFQSSIQKPQKTTINMHKFVDKKTLYTHLMLKSHIHQNYDEKIIHNVLDLLF